MLNLIAIYLTKIPMLFFHVANQASCNAQKASGFFGIPKWYEYLPYKFSNVTNQCEIMLRDASTNVVHYDRLWLIGLAGIDILLRVAGLVAVIFVIYGGFTYITSQGEPDKTAEARNTIINALIGVVIAVLSVTIVHFVGKKLGG